jgi:arylsulfatase A-like enzyme
MKRFLLPLTLILAFTPLARVAAEDADRPNILYFYVDDMGWGSIGPNGQAEREAAGLPTVRTPNIDQLAEEGINFTRGYGCHVCSPARSSQQTGFHQGHTFADDNDPNNAKKAMRADDITMGDALSDAGYVTGYWGKWGYGGSADKITPTIDNVQTLPTSHGYKHVLTELHHVRAHTFFQPTLWSAPSKPDAIGGIELVPNSMAAYQDNDDYPSMPALQNDPAYPETAYCDDAYAFAALDFVRNQGCNYNESGQPFFGLLACQIPHAPFGEIASLPEWDAEYANDPLYADLANQTQQWAAMVTRIDAHFGNILAALEDPNNDGDTSDSIVDDTLVIFQSDNGGPGGANNVELNANGGLSGNKGRIQEGGIRVPLVMRWPSKITPDSELKAGTDCDRVVDVTDMLPTFCDLAGVDAPLGIDGVSIAPTLRGEGHQRPREFIIHEAGNGESIIRGNIKLVQSKNGELSLFDLEADHAEDNDIAADNPELVEELHELLLGERVLEPRGFANTYHEWIGENGADASDPDNWSDYVYENAGVTYMTDEGAPQLSWVARIETNHIANVALATSDLEFLGLEIRGNSQEDAIQALQLNTGVNLTARNEIQLRAKGFLNINGGTVSTLRWIEIQPEAMLYGFGSIEGAVYNDGRVFVLGNNPLNINGDYCQSTDAGLSIYLKHDASLSVTGEASLSGELLLVVSSRQESQPTSGQSFTVLTAGNITGKFSNPNDEYVSPGGARFDITYTDTEVILTAK